MDKLAKDPIHGILIEDHGDNIALYFGRLHQVFDSASFGLKVKTNPERGSEIAEEGRSSYNNTNTNSVPHTPQPVPSFEIESTSTAPPPPPITDSPVYPSPSSSDTSNTSGKKKNRWSIFGGNKKKEGETNPTPFSLPSPAETSPRASFNERPRLSDVDDSSGRDSISSEFNAPVVPISQSAAIGASNDSWDVDYSGDSTKTPSSSNFGSAMSFGNHTFAATPAATHPVPAQSVAPAATFSADWEDFGGSSSNTTEASSAWQGFGNDAAFSSISPASVTPAVADGFSSTAAAHAFGDGFSDVRVRVNLSFDDDDAFASIPPTVNAPVPTFATGGFNSNTPVSDDDDGFNLNTSAAPAFEDNASSIPPVALMVNTVAAPAFVSCGFSSNATAAPAFVSDGFNSNTPVSDDGFNSNTQAVPPFVAAAAEAEPYKPPPPPRRTSRPESMAPPLVPPPVVQQSAAVNNNWGVDALPEPETTYFRPPFTRQRKSTSETILISEPNGQALPAAPPPPPPPPALVTGPRADEWGGDAFNSLPGMELPSTSANAGESNPFASVNGDAPVFPVADITVSESGNPFDF